MDVNGINALTWARIGRSDWLRQVVLRYLMSVEYYTLWIELKSVKLIMEVRNNSSYFISEVR